MDKIDTIFPDIFGFYEQVLGSTDTDWHKLQRKMLGDFDFIYQFRTIEIKVPRRSGKTKTLSKIARNKNSLLVVPHRMMAQEIRDNHAHANEGSDNKKSLVIIDDHSLNNPGDYFRGCKFECVLVDEYCYFTPYQQDLLKRLINDIISYGVPEDFFVLKVGT